MLRTTPHLWFAGSLALLGASACGDLNVRSVAAREVVPAQLEGEWRGSWTSTRDNTTGVLVVRVQEFDLQPVVSLQIDNPCLPPRAYELAISGGSIALRAEGVTVFQAELDEEGGMSGNYGCLADGGYWSAERVGPLPELEDLSGAWSGVVTIPGVFEQELSILMEMSVDAGALVLDAIAEAPNALAEPVPMRGFVQFRDADFDIVLRSDDGVSPVLLFSGVGARDPLRVEAGLVQILDAPPELPFSQALFQIEQLPD